MPRHTHTVKIIIVLSLSILFASCQVYRYPVKSYNSAGQGIYHTVKKGQNLFRIAQAYRVNVKLLKRVNALRDPDKIKVGRRLWIPHARRVLHVSASRTSARNKGGKTKRLVKKSVKGYLRWPIKGTLTSRFGFRKGRHHDGIDIAARKGENIVGAAGGTVVFSGWGPTGYGLMVIVKHPKHHLMTVYAHNSKNYVKVNMNVQRGQKIASIGSTGRSTGPHLHFEVRNDAHPVNPLHYLPRQ